MVNNYVMRFKSVEIEDSELINNKTSHSNPKNLHGVNLNEV
jgi:hypothetical protein